MNCPYCGESEAACPECNKTFQHGEASHCDNPPCVEMNAPLDCVGCCLTVEKDRRGVLTLDMSLIPYSNQPSALKHT